MGDLPGSPGAASTFGPAPTGGPSLPVILLLLKFPLLFPLFFFLFSFFFFLSP